MAKEKSEAHVDRVYTIPLMNGLRNAPRGKKANRAVNDIKRFLIRHTKTNSVMVSEKLNQLVWKRGISKPPSSVKVKVSIKEGVATARLPEEIVIEKKDKKSKPAPKNKIEELKQKAEEMKAGKEEAKKDVKQAEKTEEKKEEAKPEDKKEETKSEPVREEKPKKDEANSKQ